MANIDQRWAKTWIEGVWGAGTTFEEASAIIQRFVAPNARLESLDIDGGTAHGTQEYLGYWKQMHEAFPDISCRLLDWGRDGSKVFLRYSCTGTHCGHSSWLGRPSNRPFQFTGTCIDKIDPASGLIVEEHNNYDALKLLTQIGVVQLPAMPGKQDYRTPMVQAGSVPKQQQQQQQQQQGFQAVDNFGNVVPVQQQPATPVDNFGNAVPKQQQLQGAVAGGQPQQQTGHGQQHPSAPDADSFGEAVM